MVIRDLNEFISADKKLGGRSIWRRILYLKKFIENVGGIDLGFIGKRYTWENNHEGFAYIKERLDWGVANKNWVELHPLALVKHLRTEESDHCPIILQLETKVNKAKKQFRFLQAWTTDVSSLYVVNIA